MKGRMRNRTLGFERLESKATPSTLLLALAPMDETFHVQAEQLRHAATESASYLVADTSANWQISIPTRELLQFVENHTCCRDRDTAAVELPSAEQCRHVDEMMKLEDVGARAAIIADRITSD